MSPDEMPQDVQPRSRRGCWLGAVLLIIIGACGGVGVGVLRTLAEEPNSIRMEVFYDSQELTAGEAYMIQVVVENVDVDPVIITGVGLDEGLTDGLTLATTDPSYRKIEDRSYPFIGKWTEYSFERQLNGGETLVITMTLTADERGSYSGDVSVWIDYDLLGWTVSRARREALDFNIR